MANAENLIEPWKPGQSGNPKGYPMGIPNRATITRKILQIRIDPPKEIATELYEYYPDLKKRLSIEELITLVLGIKAVEGDTQSYKALMDSAYGRPQLDVTTDGNQIQGDLQINVQTPEQASELQQFIEYVRKLQ